MFQGISRKILKHGQKKRIHSSRLMEKVTYKGRHKTVFIWGRCIETGSCYCSPVCPQTHDPTVSISQLLELQVCRELQRALVRVQATGTQNVGLTLAELLPIHQDIHGHWEQVFRDFYALLLQCESLQPADSSYQMGNGSVWTLSNSCFESNAVWAAS